MTAQEDYDRKQIKIISEGDVYCCGEYTACEYLIDAMSITNLELGLRWLHDRAYESLYANSPRWNVLTLRAVCYIELGLRWLHDLSSRCTDCGAISERMIRLWPLDINKPSRRRCSECVRARGSIIDWSL